MDMVDSTVGSSIVTGWNRRSKAASLPMVLRYSSAEGEENEKKYKYRRLKGPTSCGTNKLQTTRKCGFDHLSSINTAFSLSEVE
jgi:hypothetical protein